MSEMEQQANTEQPPTERIIKAYIKMRDARAELKKKYEEEDGVIERQMETLESALLEVCKAAGANSINTPVGSVIRQTKTRYWTSDWESMHEFIKERINDGGLNLLERRVAQKNMGEFLENHPDLLPKGMNVEAKYTVVVRRK